LPAASGQLKGIAVTTESEESEPTVPEGSGPMVVPGELVDSVTSVAGDGCADEDVASKGKTLD